MIYRLLFALSAPRGINHVAVPLAFNGHPLHFNGHPLTYNHSPA